MSLPEAQRLSEILVAIACLQAALEHTAAPRLRWRAIGEAAMAAAAAGVAPALTLGALFAAGLDTLRRFGGPYNGGSDRMRLLVLLGLWVARVAPDAAAVGLGYVAVQIVLSYAMAGWVKLANRDWRNGRALIDVFAFSVYPVSEGLRGWAGRPRALLAAAWVMLLFEAAFPLVLLHPLALRAGLAAALAFHLVNACVFGLNRFVWAWMAGYPLLLWFQQAASAALAR